jgi:CCR4-NOT transcription complex subunit 2
MNSASNVIRNNSMPLAPSSSSSATNTDFAAALSRAAAVGGAASNVSTTTTTSGGLNNKNQVFKIANEDFPALPGSSTSISINATTGSNPNHNSNSHHPSFVYSSSSEDGGSLFPQQFLFQQQQQHQPTLDHTNAPLTGSSLLALLANPSSSNNPSTQQQQQKFLLSSSSTVTASSPALVSKIMGSTISSSNTPLRGNAPTASAPTALSSSSSLPTTTVATTATTSSTVGSAGSGAGVVLSGEYGLLGLLGRIRVSSDDDCNLLALGSDLTCLELELNSPEPLYKTFSGPWSTSSYSSTEENSEPLYAIPSCYYVQPIPALKTGHLAKFQLETLFYIFYGIPQDILQAYAAQELYSRDWRFHADFQLWMKPIVLPNDSNNGNNNNNTGTGNATTPTQQFIYFDTHLWERRLLNTAALNASTSATSFITSATANNTVGSTSTSIPQSAPSLTNMFVLNGFLSEEDIRVKVVSHHT